MITGKKVRIREKKPEDASNDYTWSRDAELSRLDAAHPLNSSLSNYISEYTAELRYPSLTRRRYAIETMEGIHIGNCSYYNIDLKRNEAEVGVMIGNRDYWGKGYGTDIIQTLVDYVFANTKFKRLYLKTLDWNLRAQHCFQKSGFKPYNQLVRDGYNFILMELSRERWQKIKSELKQDEQTAQNAVPIRPANPG